jgi:hypothetical protein
MTAPLERDFQTKFLEDLRKLKQSFWAKLNDRVSHGILDIWGFYNGHGIVIELKTKSKESGVQRVVAKRLKRAGALTYIATHENASEVLAHISALPDRRPGGKQKPRKERKLDSVTACSPCPTCLKLLGQDRILKGQFVGVCKHKLLVPIITQEIQLRKQLEANQNEEK